MLYIKDICDIDGSEFSDGAGTRNNDQRTLEVGKSTIPLSIIHSIFHCFRDKGRNRVIACDGSRVFRAVGEVDGFPDAFHNLLGH
jgi:hypothetical protein